MNHFNLHFLAKLWTLGLAAAHSGLLAGAHSGRRRGTGLSNLLVHFLSHNVGQHLAANVDRSWTAPWVAL